MMNKAYEVVISKTYYVEAPDFTEARRKALACSIGASKDCEFGGMKVTAMAYNKKVRYNKKEKEPQTEDPLVNADQDLESLRRICPDCGSEFGHFIGCRSLHKHEKRIDNAIDAFKRTDRSVGKEQEYLDFSTSDGI